METKKTYLVVNFHRLLNKLLSKAAVHVTPSLK